jgi:hypothetical protein
VSERTTDWAFTLLRPVLKELKVQKLKKKPHVVKASAYKKLIVAGMGKWVIIAHQTSFQDGTKGFAEIIFSKTHNLFLLMIYIDEKLFVNDDCELRTQRKMVGVHEFVHGSAHMCLESFLKSERYIELMDKSIIAKMKMTTSEEFNEMLLAIGELGTKDGAKHEMFTDDHFRLLGKNLMDGFEGNYAELYTELMLSYQLVSETITAFKLQNEGTGANISRLLTFTINELIQSKALDREFVLGRIKLFLPMLYVEFLNE